MPRSPVRVRRGASAFYPWLVAALLFCVVFASLRLVSAFTQPAAVGARAPITLVIRPGTRLTGIAGDLRRAGIIRYAWAFEVLAVWRGRARTLQAGVYSLSPSMTPQAVLSQIAGGDVAARRVTVPEGWNAAQIVAILGAGHLGGSAAQLLAGADDPALLAAAALPAPALGTKVALEGYLFPDTYAFPANATPAQIFGRMLTQFNRAWTPELAAAARANDGLDTAQAVTLASIVQREVGNTDQMPAVAGIYLHRLRLGMKLDADPTVLYALGLVAQQTPLSAAQTATASPYNTYLVTGLPPGPICNPGAAALQAVAHPTSTTALYFLTDHAGGLITADTLQQQLANQRKYLGG